MIGVSALIRVTREFVSSFHSLLYQNTSVLLLLVLNCFSRVRLCATPQKAAHQASRPWDSPGKNTGVGCHFLLQCMKVKSESEVTQSCPTLATPWTAAYQAPPSMGFSRQKYWSGVPLPSPVQQVSSFQIKRGLSSEFNYDGTLILDFQPQKYKK